MDEAWKEFGETLDLKIRNKAQKMHENIAKDGIELP